MSYSWKWPAMAIVVIAIIVGIGFAMGGPDHFEITPEKTLPRVEVRPFARLLEDSSVTRTGIIEPASSAPLVARLGGRVTKLRYNLGEIVHAGSVIVDIDGGSEGNPTEAQLVGASRTLVLFDEMQKVALAAASTAVEIAQQNNVAAADQEPLTKEQAAIARRLADNSVKKTELALQDARDSGVDDVVAAADLANKAAGLVQDQATVSRQLVTVQAGNLRLQAKLALKSALLGQQRIMVELATQRVQLEATARVAKEQHTLQQITAPVNGSITSLTARVGDVIAPGQVIGEVNALEGAFLSINVGTTSRHQLAVGQTVPIIAARQEFTGEVVRIAGGAATTTGLWQVDIAITSTPRPLEPNETVSVVLPSSPRYGTVFIPLDALTVRQSGTLLFTVNDSNQVIEHVVEVIGYSGDFVEARVSLTATDAVVIRGNRLLRAGDTVEISN